MMINMIIAMILIMIMTVIKGNNVYLKMKNVIESKFRWSFSGAIRDLLGTELKEKCILTSQIFAEKEDLT